MAKNEERRTLERTHISIPNDLKEWYKKEAEALGLSMSVYMMIALQQFREQKEISESLGKVMKRLEEIEGKI